MTLASGWKKSDRMAGRRRSHLTKRERSRKDLDQESFHGEETCEAGTNPKLPIELAGDVLAS
jgi:hypothetical protein